MCQFSYMQNNVCIPSKGIENCIFYESSTKCNQCDWGFSLIENRTLCVKSEIEHCAIQIQDQCVACSNNAIPVMNSCLGTKKCFDKNCMVC